MNSKRFILLGLAGILIIASGCSEENQPVKENPPVTQTLQQPNEPATTTPEDPSKPTMTQPQELAVTDIKNHPVEKEMEQFLASGAAELGEQGLFRPDEEITRGEFVQWMYRYHPQIATLSKQDSSGFTDVLPDSPYFDLINTLHKEKLIKGFPDGTFLPEKTLTREELTLLWGWYHNHKNVKESFKLLKARMGDIVKKEPISEEYIYAMAEYRHFYPDVFGETHKFRPQQAVTRAEAAKWIIKYYRDEEPFSPTNQIKVTVQGDSTAKSLEDVPKDITKHRYEAEITKLVKSGAVPQTGDGLFYPDQKITRGEFIEWLYRYNNRGINPHKPEVPSFSDLGPEHRYYSIVEGLKAAGILSGYPDGTMKVDKELTREEISFIWGWYVEDANTYSSMDFSALLWGTEDRAQIGKDFVNSIASFRYVYKQLFIMDNKLKPQQSVTRAEAAAWIKLAEEERSG